MSPEFQDLYERGSAQLVTRMLPADLETPVAAFLKLAGNTPHSFLFESIEGGKFRGRYSFLGMDPDLVWRARGDVAEVARIPETVASVADALHDSLTFVQATDPTLQSLKALVAESRFALPEGVPPMVAGLFGFLGYGCAGLAERLPQHNPDPLGLPDGLLLRPRLMVIFDHVTETLTLATPVYPAGHLSAAEVYAAAHERLNLAEARLSQPVPRFASQDGSNSGTDSATVTSNMTEAEFCQIVERGKDYIRAGDIFQCVPSQRFSRPFRLPPFSLYRSLRRLNPSPFLFYLNLGDFHLVGSSPEILVRLRDGTVTVRPIAGTRPRGKTAAEDQALAADLLADPKERAEHLMLLDLGRNDVGRVAAPGSVRVTEQFTIEYYSHVMHIVSNVEGRLRDGCDAIDALLAGFPAGTVSGAPKIRAMEIIDELEPVRRAFYAGAVGYFSAGGDMDTCIALRTALIKDGMLHVQAGAGVVADSVPESEYLETVNKARALLKAAENARAFVYNELDKSGLTQLL